MIFELPKNLFFKIVFVLNRKITIIIHKNTTKNYVNIIVSVRNEFRVKEFRLEPLVTSKTWLKTLIKYFIHKFSFSSATKFKLCNLI